MRRSADRIAQVTASAGCAGGAAGPAPSSGAAGLAGAPGGPDVAAPPPLSARGAPQRGALDAVIFVAILSLGLTVVVVQAVRRNRQA